MVTNRRTAGLLLIQTGATAWDRLGRLQGTTDLPLSDEGRADVDARARGLTGTHLSLIISAPDEASRQTAQAFARATRSKVRVREDLAEPALGLWEGLAMTELEQRCRAGRTFVEDGPGVVPPGATECLGEYRSRLWPAVMDALSAAKAGPRGSVALVLRPLALGVCRCELDGEPLESIWTMVRDRPAMEWYDWGRTQAPRAPRAVSQPAPVGVLALRGRLA